MYIPVFNINTNLYYYSNPPPTKGLNAMHYSILNLKNDNVTSPFECLITHKDKSVRWRLTSLSRTTIKSDNIFDQLNSYLTKLPEAVKDQMFGYIEECSEVVNNASDIMQKQILLTKLVRNILSFLVYDDLINWCTYNQEIPIPNTFKDSYVEDIDKFTTRAGTYTRPDYVQLISMTIAIRAVLPIMVELMEVGTEEIGKKHREYFVFSLLAQSQYYRCIAMEKLRNYIKSSIDKVENNSESILSGIGSEDYVEMMLAGLILRRVCIVDISESTDSHNFVTYIYKSIDQKKRDILDRNTKGVKEKVDVEKFDTSSKISNIEIYKLKQEISVGEMVAVEQSYGNLSNIIKNLVGLDNEINMSILGNSLKTASALLHVDIYNPQIRMLQWLFMNIIPPQTFYYLSRKSVVQLIALGETMLLQKGLYMSAILLSMTVMKTNDHVTTTTGSRARLPSDIISELEYLYPHEMVQIVGGKERKRINYAIAGIEKTTDELSLEPWRSTMSIELFRSFIDSNASDTRFLIPKSIKIDLANIILFGNTLSLKSKN